MSILGKHLLLDTIPNIIDNKTTYQKQDETKVTFGLNITKEQEKIDFSKSKEEIKNLVRGLNPIMGAYTFLNGKKIKFWKVDIASQKEIYAEGLEILRNGTVLVSDPRDGLFIKTKEGILKVLEIQGENAKKMPIGDFLRGNKIEEYSIFK